MVSLCLDLGANPMATELARQRIREEGATICVHGDAWDEANQLALKLVREDPSTAYIPPFDDPAIWEVCIFPS